MKLLIGVAIATFLVCIKHDATAQVKPYIAVVNTGKANFKGVLYKVNADSIGIKKDENIVFFRAENIKSITLKEIKRGSKYKKYLTNYSTYNEKRYEKVSKKMVPVRKWGEKDATLEEELSGRILTGVYSAAINSLGTLLNGNLSVILVNYNKDVYAREVRDLSYHCIPLQNTSVQLIASK